MTDQPRWLAKADVIQLHDYVLARTGGSPGLRDEGLLESALARPLNRWSYEAVEDIRDLSATYAVGLAKNHPFVDGNKRAAFLGMGLFLELNGWRLTATDDDATATFYALAASQIDEPTLAAWIRDNSAAT
ncbi:type II toxin-antitoxin system death-on-curing family toxin [Brevundimonas sp.]|jgi:death-on-curing protein|uniref:type II toxin-antitoxin system death-on-curing family toxin n=1 Tax=Brevundimonas sp. TaxID=1871086 RepID=UPI0025C2BADA|nr:type II toxin-antitoxin system death-on-curing family toxin [Brevundimonas sp.]